VHNDKYRGAGGVINASAVTDDHFHVLMDKAIKPNQEIQQTDLIHYKDMRIRIEHVVSIIESAINIKTDFDDMKRDQELADSQQGTMDI
tara:strand:- start:951 stop:1217 length:267 start_codon:yes stop_codon:yes gene_type:complete